VHVPVGKLSFEPQKLIDNATTVISSIVRAKPSAARAIHQERHAELVDGPWGSAGFRSADAGGKH